MLWTFKKINVIYKKVSFTADFFFFLYFPVARYF